MLIKIINYYVQNNITNKSMFDLNIQKFIKIFTSHTYKQQNVTINKYKPSKRSTAK